MPRPPMIQETHRLTPEQSAHLTAEAERAGCSRSEVLRRELDLAMEVRSGRVLYLAPGELADWIAARVKEPHA